MHMCEDGDQGHGVLLVRDFFMLCLDRDRFGGNTYMCILIGFTRNAVQAFRRGTIYSSCVASKTILPVVHRLHHAQCLEAVRRLRAFPEDDVWVHTNALTKAIDNSKTAAGKLLAAYNEYLSTG